MDQNPRHSNADERSGIATMQRSPARAYRPSVAGKPSGGFRGPIAKSLLKWHGGKTYLCREILSRFPADIETFIDLFCGGGVITLNTERFPIRVMNDADPLLMHFHRTHRDHPQKLKRHLRKTRYDESTFAAAVERTARNRELLSAGHAWADVPEAVAVAADFLIANRMSRGGLFKSFAWSYRLRGGQPGDLNAWENSQTSIVTLANRLVGVEMTSLHFRDALNVPRAGRVLCYADPPYLAETRTAKNAYHVEMSADEHAELLALLDARARQGWAVILSGYGSTLYESALRGWGRIEIDMPNHSGQGLTKQRRTETLWLSPTVFEVEAAA